MNVLEFDIGNSRIKWRFLEPGQNRITAQSTAKTVEELLASSLTTLSPDLIRVANVRADDSLALLTDFSLEKWQIQPVIAQVSQECGGVRNGYGDISRMGVDRWLAMLAAYNEFHSAALVVDGGTAFTLDLLDGNGQHLGGYILPGLSLMESALQANTAIRLQDSAGVADTSPGRITEAAVRNGCLGSVVALIEKNLDSMQRSNSEVILILGGGDAGILLEALQINGVTSVELRSDLVLDGLAIACPVGET